MLISELFARLSYGELSNLSISNEGSGTIVEDKRPKIIAYANEALVRIYSRFVLKLNDVVIEPAEDKTFYKLDSEFSFRNEAADPETTLYIRDSENKPFTDDVIRVLEAYDVEGTKLPLNDDGDPSSIFTPQPTVVQLPYPIEEESVSLLYQAKHTTLTDDPNATIDLPATLEKALTAYVAYLTFSHMNGQENMLKSREHLETYERICREVEDKDLVSASNSTSNCKLEQRGFV